MAVAVRLEAVGIHALTRFRHAALQLLARAGLLALLDLQVTGTLLRVPS